MMLRRLRAKLFDRLRPVLKFELSVQQTCTLFILAIVVLHVGGILWILVTDETKIIP